MGIAENAFEYNRGNKTNRTQESEEQRTFRLANIYNHTLHAIDSVDSAQDFLKVGNSISLYASEVGKDNYDVTKLNRLLSDRMDELTTETQVEIDRLNEEIAELKESHFNEPKEVIQALREQSERKMLEIMLSLGTNKHDVLINKRKVGNYVTNADRVQAVALMRLSTLPDYAELFTSKQKQLLLNKAKTQAEKKFEQNKEESLKEKNTKLAKLYMKSFHIRNVLKQVSNSGYYFKK